MQNRLQREKAVTLVVDIQEKLLPAMAEADSCLVAAGKLIRACHVLTVPVLVTEQYPAGLGPTCKPLVELLGEQAHRVEKLSFTACTPQITELIERVGARQVIVCGIETHVCVQQTVLDLLRKGLEVWLCADAVSSRRPFDREIALKLMRHAGAAVTTVESVIFELLGQAGTPEFKEILKIVK